MCNQRVRGITVVILRFIYQPAARTAGGHRCPTQPGSRSLPQVLPVYISSWSPGSWILHGRPQSGWWGGSRSRTRDQAARRPATRTYEDLGKGGMIGIKQFNWKTCKHPVNLCIGKVLNWFNCDQWVLGFFFFFFLPLPLGGPEPT